MHVKPGQKPLFVGLVASAATVAAGFGLVPLAFGGAGAAQPTCSSPGASGDVQAASSGTGTSGTATSSTGTSSAGASVAAGQGNASASSPVAGSAATGPYGLRADGTPSGVTITGTGLPAGGVSTPAAPTVPVAVARMAAHPPAVAPQRRHRPVGPVPPVRPGRGWGDRRIGYLPDRHGDPVAGPFADRRFDL